MIAAAVWILMLAYRHVEYSRELWWTFAFDANAPRALRATLVVVLLATVFLLLNLLQPARPEPAVATEEDLERARKIIGQIRPHDRQRRAERRQAPAVQRRGRCVRDVSGERPKLDCAGRSGGPRAKCEELVWRFRELSDRHGGRTVFYQARGERLPLYVDLGLAALKIGEEARVPLHDFSLEGPARAGLRSDHRRAARGGASFEIVHAGTGAGAAAGAEEDFGCVAGGQVHRAKSGSR